MRMSRVSLRLIVAAASLVMTGCTSSSTSTVAPSGPKCSVTATSAPASFTSTGGSGTVSITADRDCTWSVTVDSSWIAIQGPSSGQGGTSIGYAVQSNPSTAARSGTITVAGDRLPVSQAGAPCQYALSKTGDTIIASGGQLSVGISTLSGCSWTASANVSWITVQSGRTGSSSGTIVLAVASNPNADSRTGTVTVAGQIYTVTQAAKPAPPIDFSGTISSVTGSCPQVTFHVGTLTIETDAATVYTKGGCSNLVNNAQLSGTGSVQLDGSVLAITIAFNKS